MKTTKMNPNMEPDLSIPEAQEKAASTVVFDNTAVGQWDKGKVPVNPKDIKIDQPNVKPVAYRKEPKTQVHS